MSRVRQTTVQFAVTDKRCNQADHAPTSVSPVAKSMHVPEELTMMTTESRMNHPQTRKQRSKILLPSHSRKHAHMARSIGVSASMEEAMESKVNQVAPLRHCHGPFKAKSVPNDTVTADVHLPPGPADMHADPHPAHTCAHMLTFTNASRGKKGC